MTNRAGDVKRKRRGASYMAREGPPILLCVRGHVQRAQDQFSPCGRHGTLREHVQLERVLPPREAVFVYLFRRGSTHSAHGEP